MKPVLEKISSQNIGKSYQDNPRQYQKMQINGGYSTASRGALQGAFFRKGIQFAWLSNIYIICNVPNAKKIQIGHSYYTLEFTSNSLLMLFNVVLILALIAFRQTEVPNINKQFSPKSHEILLPNTKQTLSEVCGKFTFRFPSTKNKFIQFIPSHQKNNNMNFEDAEIHNTGESTPKPTIHSVIVLTDNRKPIPSEQPNPNGPKSSAIKESDLDPLQFPTGMHNDPQDGIIAQLTRRITLLEEKVGAMSRCQGGCRSAARGGRERQPKMAKKKNRRKFKQLVRDNMCPQCRKVYGSDTALKYHLKLKHHSTSSHSQVQ